MLGVYILIGLLPKQPEGLLIPSKNARHSEERDTRSVTRERGTFGMIG